MSYLLFFLFCHTSVEDFDWFLNFEGYYKTIRVISVVFPLLQFLLSHDWNPLILVTNGIVLISLWIWLVKQHESRAVVIQPGAYWFIKAVQLWWYVSFFIVLCWMHWIFDKHLNDRTCLKRGGWLCVYVMESNIWTMQLVATWEWYNWQLPWSLTEIDLVDHQSSLLETPSKQHIRRCSW